MEIRAAVFHQSKHLDADQLGPLEEKCAFCGSTKRRPLCRLQNDPEVILVECANCHAASASRMPTDRALAEYYNEDMLLPEDSRISITRKPALENISCKYSFVIASAIIEHIPKPQGILDFCFSLMEKGSVFYARTPCMFPIMKVCGRVGIKLDLTFPAHVHDLGQWFWESYFNRVVSIGAFRILRSNPSIVETTFKDHFLKTVAAHALKAPWYLIGRSYKLVGGWEVFVQKN